VDLTIDESGASEVDKALDNFYNAIPVTTQHIALLAAGMTIDSARPTIPVRSGDAKRSLRHYLTDSGGATAEGGGSIEYYRWLELGGLSGRKHTTRRDIVTDGRYLYPGYLRIVSAVQSMAENEIGKTIQQSGLG
jgi:hypothetical protein